VQSTHVIHTVERISSSQTPEGRKGRGQKGKKKRSRSLVKGKSNTIGCPTTAGRSSKKSSRGTGTRKNLQKGRNPAFRATRARYHPGPYELLQLSVFVEEGEYGGKEKAAKGGKEKMGGTPAPDR